MNWAELRRVLDEYTNIEHGRGITAREVDLVERELGVTLPEEYRSYLMDCGWIGVDCDTLYGCGADAPDCYGLVSIVERERYDAEPRIPAHFIPIMNDGAGNNYCLDTRRIQGATCPVVFWDHESEWGSDQNPDDVAPTFVDWLARAIADREEWGHIARKPRQAPPGQS